MKQYLYVPYSGSCELQDDQGKRVRDSMKLISGADHEAALTQARAEERERCSKLLTDQADVLEKYGLLPDIERMLRSFGECMRHLADYPKEKK